MKFGPPPVGIYDDTGALIALMDSNGIKYPVSGSAGITAITGDGTAAGTGTVTLTLNQVNSTAGTYAGITFNNKGLITNAVAKTTLSGYGITDALSSSLLGANSGVAQLDSTGKVPVGQLPSSITGATTFKGVWNAATNTPTIVSGSGTNGWYYQVSTAGTTTIDGISTWAPGDYIIFNTTTNTWGRVASGGIGVTSVNGHSGAVNLVASDFTWLAASATTDTTNAANITAGILPDARLNNIITAGSGISDGLHVPVPTWDSHGRITGVSNVAISSSLITSGIIAPTNITAPFISSQGNSPYSLGQVLFINTGSWANNPTSFSYQWQRAGANISGATSQTYIVIAADVTAAALTCVVTAINAAGSSTPITTASVALSSTPTQLYTFESDTAGSAPANITYTGAAPVVVNTGVTGWTGNYLTTSGTASGNNVFTLSNLDNLSAKIANQSLTLQYAQTNTFTGFGVLLRNQGVGSTAAGFTNKGYFYAVTAIGVSIYNVGATTATLAASYLWTYDSINSGYYSWYNFSISGNSNAPPVLKINASTDGINFVNLLTWTDSSNTYPIGSTSPQLVTGFGTTRGSYSFFNNISLLLGRSFYMAASGGNDGAAGTLASAPWATLSASVYKLRPGDTLNLLAGTYAPTGAQAFATYGLAGTIDAPITITGPVNTPPSIGSGTNQVFINLAGITGTECIAILSNYFKLSHLDVYGSPAGHAITYLSSANGINIYNIGAHSNNLNGIWTDDTCFDTVISNCSIYGNVQSNNAGALYSSGWSQGLNVGGTRTIAFNNLSYNNWGEGINIEKSTNCHVFNNISHDNYSQCCYIDHGTGNIVENNFFYCSYTSPFLTYIGAGIPAYGIGITDESSTSGPTNNGNIVRNNLVVNCSNGFRYDNYGLGTGLKNTIIANNTFVDSYDTAINILSPSLAAGCIIENNLVYSAYHISRLANPDAIGQSGLTYRNNLWYATGANASNVTNSIGNCGPQSALPGENDIYADPLFVNYITTAFNSSNYALSSGSPAIGSALSSAYVQYDFTGAKRNASTEIGAFQYLAKSTETSTNDSTFSDSSSYPASTNWVRGLFASISYGIGQLPYDMTSTYTSYGSSGAAGSTYFNTTGKPINVQLVMFGQAAGGGSALIYVNGSPFAYGATVAGSEAISVANATIPVGGNFALSWTSTGTYGIAAVKVLK